MLMSFEPILHKNSVIEKCVNGGYQPQPEQHGFVLPLECPKCGSICKKAKVQSRSKADRAKVRFEGGGTAMSEEKPTRGPEWAKEYLANLANLLNDEKPAPRMEREKTARRVEHNVNKEPSAFQRSKDDWFKIQRKIRDIFTNQIERKIILIGICMIFLMGLFPPWTDTFHRAGMKAVEKPAGYSFLLTPPSSERITSAYYGVQIDFSRLLLQWFLMAIAGGGVVFAMRAWKMKKE